MKSAAQIVRVRMGRKLFDTTRYGWDRGRTDKGKSVVKVIIG